MNTSTTISIIVIAIVIIGAGAYIMGHGSSDSAVVVESTPLITQATATPTTTPEVSSSPSVSPQPTTTADGMNAQNPTVSITDQGISPAVITVKSGTTVTFVNNGQQLHWPASDPHPIHTDLPGFDSKRGLAAGDLYRFTFVKVGSFGMHDHLHPSFKAQIIVQ